MGERVYGAEAAAKLYFHRSAASLSPQQAALLAGCLPNPRIMNPAAPNKRLRWRQHMILSRMRRWGYLMEEEVLKPAPTVPTDTALRQTPPTDTASPAPVTPSGSEGPGGTGGAPTETTETTSTTDTAAAPPPAQPPR
jgi:membrane peptidoglycan carboxypeptidase